MKKHLLLFLLLFHIAQSVFGEEWLWQFPLPQGNTLNGVHVFDQNTAIAVGGAGTVMITSNGGNEWEVTHYIADVNEDLKSIHFIDFLNGWIIGTGGILLKSNDAGKTWKLIESGTTEDLCDIYFADVSTGWIVGKNGFIIKTLDGGLSWKKLTSGVSLDLYSVHFIDTQVGWAVGNKGIILKTEDGGNMWWLQRKESYSGVLKSLYAIDKQTCWAVGSVSEGHILKTTDGGTNWVSISVERNQLNSIYFIDDKIGWAVGYLSEVLMTIDGGENWRTPTQNASVWELNNVCFVDTQTGWAVGEMGDIVKTIDGGMTWLKQNANSSYLPLRLNDVYFFDLKHGIVIGNNSFETKDGGLSWISLTKIKSLYELFSICFLDSGMGWIATSGGEVLKTIDGGTSWETHSIGFPLRIISIYFVDSQNGWTITQSFRGGQARSTIFCTRDGGITWHSLFSGDLSLDDIHFINKNTGFAVGTMMAVHCLILRTDDSGVSWAQQPLPTLSSYYTPLRSIFFIDQVNGWTVGDNIILNTSDGGNHWNEQKTQFNGLYKSVYFIDPQTGWVVGDTGVILYTADGGANWISQRSGSNRLLSSCYFVDSKSGWVVGDNTILTTKTGGVVSVKENITIPRKLPEQFLLSQNYPNPFNPSTIIRFALPQQTKVRLQVFDLLGREVTVLIDEEMSAGEHHVVCKLAHLPNGVYIYRLSAGEFMQQRKMILLK